MFPLQSLGLAVLTIADWLSTCTLFQTPFLEISSCIPVGLFYTTDGLYDKVINDACPMLYNVSLLLYSRV